MDEKEIRKYADILEEYRLTGIEVSRDGSTLRLEKMYRNGENCNNGKLQNHDKVNSESFEEKSIENKNNEYGKGIKEVISPIVGLYFSSPSKDSGAYVRIGDKVKKGDILCVIESMKLMNEIPSEYDGVIMEICVENGQIVDFGCPLFKLRVDDEDE